MIIISDFSYFQLAFFVGFILTGNFGLMHAIIIRLDQYFESDLQRLLGMFTVLLLSFCKEVDSEDRVCFFFHEHDFLKQGLTSLGIQYPT